MKKIFHCLFLLITSAFIASGQQASLMGSIKDTLINAPVRDARIFILENSMETKSDEKGNFLFQNIPFGTYTLEISIPDFETVSRVIIIDKNEVNLGEINLTPSASAVTSSDEIPIITFGEEESKSSSQNVSSALTSSRDVFVAAAIFNFSIARFRIRGYEDDNSTELMNGIPVIDLTSGRTMYRTWSGLNDVLRNRDNSFGLSPATFAFGGIGGSSSVDSRASRQRKQLQASFSVSNRTYDNRLMVTYGSGVSKKGWSFALSGSKRWADEGYVEGTFYDGYSYFGSLEKIIDKHSVSLTGFGSPSSYGRASPSVQEMYDIAGTNYYNPNWGFQEGEKRNASVGKSHQPVIILMHEWDLSNKAWWTSSLGYTFGKNKLSALDWYNAPDPRPDYYRNLPSYYSGFPEIAAQIEAALKSSEELRQINWTKLYEANYNNIETIYNVNGIEGNNITGARANYIVEYRVSDTKNLAFNSTYNRIFTDVFSFTSGATYLNQKTDYYKEVNDLLGADFYVDFNQYAEQDYPGNSDALQNDLNNPNRLLDEGDRFGYDYTANVSRGSGWLQGVWKMQRIDAFAGLELSSTKYFRTGNVRNGVFADNSFGDSDKENFFNYALKGGATVKIDGRNYVYANLAYLTRAPLFENSFVSARTRNDMVADIDEEQVFSAEGGYLLRAPRLKARLGGFITQFNDQINTVSFYHDDFRTFVNYSLTNIDKRHVGTEIAADANLGKGFSANAVASIGEYVYTDRPLATITQDNSAEVIAENEIIYAKNLRVAGSPQKAYSAGLSYRSKRFWMVSLSANFFDDIYLDFNPARRTQAGVDLVEAGSDLWKDILQQEKPDAQFTLDAFASWSWRVNNKWKSLKRPTFLVFNAGLNNIFNNTDFITGGYEQLRYDFIDKNPDKFAPKYFYAYGTNFFISAILRIN